MSDEFHRLTFRTEIFLENKYGSVCIERRADASCVLKVMGAAQVELVLKYGGTKITLEAIRQAIEIYLREMEFGSKVIEP